jgi:soluble cytochrome b562/uncharacterized protein YbjQ (UPF0145 family)
MGSSFGGTVKLSGENEYRQALTNITSNLKVLGSELKIITSQYDKNDKSTENLSQQNEILNKKIDEQKNKIEILKDALESAKRETGENSTTTKKWQIELNNAQAELNKLEKEINDNNKEIENFEKGLKEDVKELDKSEKSLNENNKELKNMSNNFDDAGNSGLKFGDIIKANVISDVIISGVKKLGSTILDVGKGFINIGKQAFESYASYEQLVGGVDTLFGESSQKVQRYAAAAYETAGMTSNEYMETVTSFSASLLQSLKGDTDKAAESANQALIDMSDNANKMGTSMESIQNAYQRICKTEIIPC